MLVFNSPRAWLKKASNIMMKARKLYLPGVSKVGMFHKYGCLETPFPLLFKYRLWPDLPLRAFGVTHSRLHMLSLLS